MSDFKATIRVITEFPSLRSNSDGSAEKSKAHTQTPEKKRELVLSRFCIICSIALAKGLRCRSFLPFERILVIFVM